MEVFINFLIDNYIWFLVISGVLLFALIGYLVDTSKLPKEPKEPKDKEIVPKEPKPKKEKKKKDKKVKKGKKENKEDILIDNTPTVEEAMKQEQEQQTEQLEVNNDEIVSAPIEITPNNGGYDMPLMKDENNENK